MDLKDSLYFEDGYSFSINNDTDPMFLLFDYGTRSYPVNMANQHYHNFHEIFIPLGEGAAHLVNGRTIPLEKGDIIFLRPQLLHMSMYPRTSHPNRRIVINFRYGDNPAGLDFQLAKIESLFNREEPVLRVPTEDLAVLVNHLNRIFMLSKKRPSGWQLEVFLVFMLFLLDASRSQRHSTYTPVSDTRSLIDMKIYSITEYIEAHYMEQITLRETAEKFAISPYYLSHQFTSILGMPFVNYVQKVRIRYALQMLSYTGARIHDIITGCGFSSSSQFNRTFSAYCGMSPSAFRRLCTSDRENIINTVNPELTEFAPSNLPPRHRLTQRRKGCHLIGVAASSLSPQGPESLSESMKLLSADTVMLDIPACFPSIGSYSALSGRKLQDLISAGISIAAVCVRGDDLASPDRSKRELASSECLAAVSVASSLGAGTLCIVPGNGEALLFLKAIEPAAAAAADHGIRLAAVPVHGSAISGVEGAERFIGAYPDGGIFLDPVDILGGDFRRNTFSFFEEIFSLLGDRITGLLLWDWLDGHPVNTGRGVMAKTYPHIAALISDGAMLIRAAVDGASISDDVKYIRRIFL